MAFNDVINNMNGSAPRRGIYKGGVNVKYFRGDDRINFRIAPAFKYETDAEGKQVITDPLSWEPFRRPDGELTDWGNTVSVCKFIGQGDWNDPRRAQIVSPTTFEPTAYCPVTELFNAAASYEEWKFLTVPKKLTNGKEQGANVSKPNKVTIMNIVDTGDVDKSHITQVGVFNKSAINSLFDSQGIACALSPQATPELIAQDYLLRWVNGDITNPENGLVLEQFKNIDKGKSFPTYKITTAQDSQGFPRRWPLNEEHLKTRVDMNDLASFIEVETAEDIVLRLVEILDMRGPNGMHVWHLLKEVFQHVAKIPDPLASPAATPTVQSGFEAQAAAPQAASGGFQQPQAAQTPAPAPQQPATPQSAPAPAQPAPQQPVAQPAPAPAPQAEAAQPPAEEQQAAPAQNTTSVAPGDAIDGNAEIPGMGQSRNDFLEQIKNQQ